MVGPPTRVGCPARFPRSVYRLLRRSCVKEAYMVAFLRGLLFPGLAAVAAFVSPALAAQAGDCRQSSLEKLKALAPDSYFIYADITDKKFFLSWISCDDLQLGLATAVHESVHHLTDDHDAFPLLDHHEI